ncbi:MAG: hypothetical protein H6619_02355 [Deltaproteobacteria bacterium]|nr:hypothetical protein [Deltaproteobacteria bacterium]
METEQRQNEKFDISEQNCANTIYTVDSFANGISFGSQQVDPNLDPRSEFSLPIYDERDVIRLRRRYALKEKNPLSQLELQLMNLSRKGILGRSHIIFGTTTDPFFPFDSKFDASMKFLNIFEKYTPGHLTIQTRSPLLVIAIPVLAKLGKRISVTIGIETNDEDSVRKYTPNFPRAEERLKAARALRRFGIEVTLQVSPVLPYGDWREDASEFAEALVGASDYIYIEPFISSKEERSYLVNGSLLGKALAQNKKYHWLRHDSAQPLYDAVEMLAPEKLERPVRSHNQEKQMSFFAA